MNPLHVFQIVDGGGTFFYVAETEEEALQLFSDSGADPESPNVCQLPDDEALAIRLVDELGRPVETRLCREWATRKCELASTEY